MTKINFNIVICIIASLTFFLSCNSDETNNEGSNLFSITGSVSSEGEKIEGASVSLTDINITTTTDQNGDFEINNLESDTYNLKIKKSFITDIQNEGSSAFSEKNFEIAVTENTNVDDLILPNPVNLHITNHNSSSIELEWDISTDIEFREYKLYRHTSSGLDENTGELIFVSTQNTTNTFIDENLASGFEYYYRIYILNDFGYLGGSNIAVQETDGMEFVINGDFENITDIQSTFFGGIQTPNWIMEGCPDNLIEYSNTTGYNSNSSMTVTRDDVGGNCGMFFVQNDIIPLFSVQPQQTLLLSFYYLNTDGPSSFNVIISEDTTGFQLVNRSNIELLQTGSANWELMTIELFISSDYDQLSNVEKKLSFQFFAPNNIGSKVVIDNISLISGN